jgi:hypothetical protein
MNDATTEAETAAPVTPDYPPGEYAIVEIMSHTTMVGRITEVERFGTKMLAIEPLFAGQLCGPIYQGGASIYRMTPCSAEIAFREQPTKSWQLPAPVRLVVPVALLEAPRPLTRCEPNDDDDGPQIFDDDDDRQF